jgi:hypothetical protein
MDDSLIIFGASVSTLGWVDGTSVGANIGIPVGDVAKASIDMAVDRTSIGTWIRLEGWLGPTDEVRHRLKPLKEAIMTDGEDKVSIDPVGVEEGAGPSLSGLALMSKASARIRSRINMDLAYDEVASMAVMLMGRSSEPMSK